MEIVNSTLSANSAGEGGALSNAAIRGNASASVEIVNSTLSGNAANYRAGAIQNYVSFGRSASLNIVNSTLSENSVTLDSVQFTDSGVSTTTQTEPCVS